MSPRGTRSKRAAKRPGAELVNAQFLAAKAVAVDRFLGGAGLPTRMAAFATDTSPEANVVGVGVGWKLVQGRRTDKPSLRFYVDRKVPKGSIPKDSLIPPVFEGVATDVVQTGRFSVHPATIAQVRSRMRPARPGCSVGFRYEGAAASKVMAGTFGAVVDFEGRTCILSNNHVLADENRLAPGKPIFQPGLLDGGDPAKDQIATLTRFLPLVPGNNTVDAAIAAADDPNDVSPIVLPSVGRLASGDPIPARVEMSVEKVGRTTAYTTGKVTDVTATMKVSYDMGELVFVDQILVSGVTAPFSARGDSGSLVVDMQSKQPTGLLFAGAGMYTLANPLQEVLKALRIKVIA
jgi:hypothetical protein